MFEYICEFGGIVIINSVTDTINVNTKAVETQRDITTPY